MSGGSHNYIYCRIEEDLCGRMHDAELNDLIKDIAQLAYDVEWYDSGDTGEDDYKESVARFKSKWFKQSRTKRLKGYIDKSIDDLRKEMYSLLGNDEMTKRRI